MGVKMIRLHVIRGEAQAHPRSARYFVSYMMRINSTLVNVIHIQQISLSICCHEKCVLPWQPGEETPTADFIIPRLMT